MEGTRFTVNPRKVVHETIDGEAILIQLETGSYYSLTRAGAEIWELLAGHLSPEEIVESLGGRYAESPETLREAVARLIGELREEGLLEPLPAEAEVSPNGAQPARLGPAAPFEPPTLEKFTDMQEFLLIDPIHEVDDPGRPSAEAT